jgi:L-lactate dehydrogenase complex protein LldE
MAEHNEKTVAIFATCVSDMMFPQTPIATTQLLERLGCTVEFPEAQTCCGQMFTNTGYFREALGSIRSYVDAFDGYDYIVAPSGSCTGAVREQFPMLTKRITDPALARKARELAAKTYDLSEFIVDVLGTDDVGAYFPHKVTYHPTCHSLRVTKVGDRPYRLMSKVKGMTVIPLPDAEQCCGFGGTFSVKNADVSTAMASDKARNVASTGAEYVITGDNSCLLNIGGVLHRDRAGVKTIHLAEVLAQVES